MKEKLSEIDKILELLRNSNLGAQALEIDESVELGEAFSGIVKGRQPTYCWGSSLGYLRGLIYLIEFNKTEYTLTKVDSDQEDLEVLGEWKDKQEALIRFSFELGKILQKRQGSK